VRRSFTLDTFRTRCPCGRMVYLMRRGDVALMPRHQTPDGRDCVYLNMQKDIMRTQLVTGKVGSPMWSWSELAKELRECRRPLP